jgi:hypothetical protein
VSIRFLDAAKLILCFGSKNFFAVKFYLWVNFLVSCVLSVFFEEFFEAVFAGDAVVEGVMGGYRHGGGFIG